MITKTIDLRPYGGIGWLVVGCSPRQFAAWTHRRFGVKSGADTPGQMLPLVKLSRPNAYVVYLQGWDWKIDEQALMVHELFHLAQAVLLDAHVNDEEATAYYLQYLVGEVWNALKD